MGTIFIRIVGMSTAAVFLMLAVILVRIPLKKAPKWFMGVLWAIVALRLVIPFQIESKIGFLPDIGNVIESYADGGRSTSYRTEVTTHVFQADGDVGSDDAAGTAEETVKEYLPAEEITTTSIGSTGTSGSLLWNELFIRLQMIWLIGMLLVIGYAVFSFVSIKKKTSASIKMEGVDRAYICDEIDTPFILGIVRPAIYLPSGLDGETTRNVIAHERAHIRRGDHLRKQFGFLLLAIHWFNPLVWISYILFCKDIELACDEKVISRMSLDEKKSYANALLLCSTHQRMVLAYPLAFGEVGVGTRVKQIFNYKKPTFWLILLLVVVSGALSTCFLTSAAESDVAMAGADVSENSESENEADSVTGSTADFDSINDAKDRLLKNWADAFIARDADKIISFSSESVQQKLIREGLLSKEDDGATFGWSSPWPLVSTLGKSAFSTCYFTDDSKTEAEFHYLATDSEPHVYVWIEKIKIAEDENGDYKVVEEHMDIYYEISSFKDFQNAYYLNSVDNEYIDYVKNGFGEYLNQNAKEDKDGLYAKLFDPAEAARYLLNLSDDDSLVTVGTGADNGEGVVVSVKFLNENKFLDILMVQPFGEDGIYVPRMDLPISNYGKLSYPNYNDETGYEITEEDGDSAGDSDSTGEGATNLPYTKDTDAETVNLPYEGDVDSAEYIDENKSVLDGE
ncbi:M56 family metallopeptidase [Butyrivibrio sp. INlla16]|uniref:M56 family metallopeptidase n=1 Tax=Butyrivibrio sp. INlla16 TaxID=1520807 RepID=UPI00087FE9F5|nr:M56 family metallopeptidase [Butyrivibrio sp. INlla16]SDB07305.1 Signal transducer regulating beta-lactamase production, contains metallopeptidase domain [Butyrivibrio sp. INlla16]